MSDQDLPLLSNIHQVRARHYLIHLKPNFDTKTIQGKVYIFFEPTTSCEKRGKCCTRDCFCLNSEIEDFVNTSSDISQQVTYKKEDGNLHNKKSDTVSKLHCNKDKGDCRANKTDVKSKEVLDEEIKIVLDCCDIRVKSVAEVSCENVDMLKYLNPNHPRECSVAFNFWSYRKHLPLQYVVDPWCIKIWKEDSTSIEQLPQAVCIDYETTPQGKSLFWRNDQDGNPCVFTPAAAINNRSVLPCQDPPSAMATWQAWVTVNKEYSVSLTGDYRPVKFVGCVEDYVEDIASLHHLNKKCCTVSERNSDIVFSRDGTDEWNTSTVCMYFYTTMVLPIATIAIAIGKWKTEILRTVHSKHFQEKKDEGEKIRYPCCHYEYPCHQKTLLWMNEIPLSVTYPPSCWASVKPLISFLPYAVEAAIHLLGVYPCCRLELVILPPCFGSLGLASPNLIFLSPTVAIDDPAAYIRLSHEISHAWFGINIGAQDWTEEWLSEGFATYMEDSIYAEAAMAYEKARNTISNQTVGKIPGNSSELVWSGAEGSSGCEGGGNPNSSSFKINDYGVVDHGHKSIVDSEVICFHDNTESDAMSKELYSGSSDLHHTRAHGGGKDCITCDKSPGIDSVFEGRKPVCDENNRNSQIFKKNLYFIKSSSLKLNKEKLEELSDVRAHIRYRTLASELENSTDELQTLRPMQGENLVGIDGINYVKNGLNPEKTFLQVHYLKGYFLLKFLSKLVGRAKFDAMMKHYVSVYHGQLVLSRHILDNFINTFPEVLEKGITRKILYNVWLHQPGLNTEIKEMYGNINNDLVTEVRQHFHYWEKFNTSRKRSGMVVKKVKVQLEAFHFSDQLVLLLEYFLQLPKLYHKTLGEINEYYSMAAQCGDVRHRWCELIIKNNYKDLTEIERFLLKDQSMGVYLYGELMISRKVKHKHLAERVFAKTRKDMDENAQLTVSAMLYGE
ncbi:aminopeptidase O-like [Homarus americanus]|uniref:Aminopeptidase O-like n=1 Tax=Homarus americanus TaxID=6706 RepID=A0A8J5JP38_HOMAM|nr:aminopeptidase O-like [Homarus americanus]XP_042235446.1 aminopeptidase O-like [Homarus americanus]KAG7161355.1 Aminopeptidase O-like [Homarus americanus]